MDSGNYIPRTINISRHDPVPSETVLMPMLMAIVLLTLSLAICEIFANQKNAICLNLKTKYKVKRRKTTLHHSIRFV